MIPNYNLYPSCAETRKANSFEQLPKNCENKYNKGLLFDFSILNKCNIDEIVKEEIKKQCFKGCSGVTSKFVYISKPCDIWNSFEYYCGNLYFKPFTVYSNSKNKRVYSIMKLVKIEHLMFEERHSLYNDYIKVLEFNEQIGYDNEIEEVEIA